MFILNLVNRKLTELAGAISIAEAQKTADRNGADWILITGEHREPIGLLRTSDLKKHPPSDVLEALVAELPSLIAMQGELDESQAISHPLMDLLEQDMPGILVVENNTPRGVWEDKAIADSLARFSTHERLMYAGDNQLPGNIKIAKIVKFCRYVQDARACRTKLVFNEKADEMPDCPNDKKLDAHKFVW